MREILFRGQRKDSKQFYYGGYHSWNGNHFIVETGKNGNLYDIEVIPETVGQYTGLTLNGVKLFEGDLFRLTFSDGYTVTKVIRYISDKCQFCVANINDLENEQYWDIWSGITKEWLDKLVSRCEVIGNIHDGEVKK